MTASHRRARHGADRALRSRRAHPRFLMAHHEESRDEYLAICSPHSPLGAALYGATAGERREVSLPAGGTMTVTLVTAVPYRSHDRPRTASRAFLR